MPRRRIAVFAVVIGTLILSVYLVRFSAPKDSRRRPLASVCFLAYSNSPSGEKWALLTVTNRDTCDLVFCGPYTVEFAPPRTNDGKLDDNTRWQVPVPP